MERENKYLVIKNADIEKHLSDEQQLALHSLITKIRVRRLHEGKVDQSYVVVAADWPMYEKVWGMIAAYVDGHPNELEQLEAENAALREQLHAAETAYGTTLADVTDERDSLREKLAASQKDAERIEWLEKLFESHWNGVVGSGSARNWNVASSHRHTTARMIGQTLRAAIDAAIEKEKAE